MSRTPVLTLMRSLAIPLLLCAGLVVAPSVATADQARQPDQSSTQMRRGDTITLTQQEAESWNLRPVYSKDSKEIGQLTALTLNSRGRITELEVAISEELGLGEKTVTLQPDQFSTDMNRIVLHLNRDQVKDLSAKQ